MDYLTKNRTVGEYIATLIPKLNPQIKERNCQVEVKCFLDSFQSFFYLIAALQC